MTLGMVLDQIRQLSAQYNQSAKLLSELPEEKNGERGGMLLSMILTRIAILDLKVDLIAARVAPEAVRDPNASRIVVPG